MKRTLLVAAAVLTSQACTLRIPGIGLGIGVPTSNRTSSSSSSASSSSGGGSILDSVDPAVAKAAAETKARATRLKDLSVVAKLPTFKPEDSFQLDKVSEAFAAIDPKSVVVLTKKSWAHWEPAPEANVEHNRYKGSSPCPTNGVGPFGGGYLRETSGFGAIRIDYDLCPQAENQPIDYDHLAEGTPGIIWSTELVEKNAQDVRTFLIFVTLDGGRYKMEEVHWEPSIFEQKVPTSIPQKPVHAFMGEHEFDQLSRTGNASAKATFEKLVATKKAWDACMSPVLDKEDAEYSQNAATSITQSQRNGKNELTAKKFAKLREDTCGKHKVQYTQHLAQSLSERGAVRTKLLLSNQTRLTKAP